MWSGIAVCGCAVLILMGYLVWQAAADAADAANGQPQALIAIAGIAVVGITITAIFRVTDLEMEARFRRMDREDEEPKL